MDPASLGAGAAALLLALAQAVTPAQDQPVWQWSSGRINIPPEANTARPGLLSWEGFEYCLEPLERLRYDDPCSRVTVRAAGQTGKSNIGVVWVGWTIKIAPRPMGLALPSGPKAASFNSKKLQPVIDKTPELRALVEPEGATSGRGSTTRQKNYPGGSLTLFSVASVNDLQSESFGAIWITESPNFPAEVGSRGSPMTQVRVRMDGWEATGTKELHESTPGEEGACPVSADYDAGDQSEVFLPCPHCEHSFRITWEDFHVPEDPAAEPYVTPPCCYAVNGAVITEADMPGLKHAIELRLEAERERGSDLGAGGWLRNSAVTEPELAAGYLPTFISKETANPAPGSFVPKADFAKWRCRDTEGRQPSFGFWQVLSPLKTWRGIAKDWRDAKGKPSEEMAFRQQKLGLPSESAVKAPPHEAMLEAVGKLRIIRGQVPRGACWLSGQADIQGDRIEWAIFAHGPTFMVRIDRGVIEHDPLGLEAWGELAKVVARRWEGPHVRPLGLDVFGVDSGGVEGVTPRVYEFTRNRPNVYAIKGSSYPIPTITDLKRHKGKDTRGRNITVQLLFIDGYPIKRFVAYGLQRLVLSAQAEAIQPGAILFEEDATEEDFRQLTAEVFKRPIGAKPGVRGEWVRLDGRANEQLDLAVYAWALAYQKRLHTWDAARWEQEFAARARVSELDAPPLEQLWETPAAPAAPPKAELAENPGADKSRRFFKKR